MRMISAIPAFGRDYNNDIAVQHDWEDGRDFLIQDLLASGYINKYDKPDNYINKYDKPDNIILKIRYNHLKDFIMIGPYGVISQEDEEYE